MAFPDFEGEVIIRDNDDERYKEKSYQYASSSYLGEGIIQPAFIIKAKTESDVIKAIKYASDQQIAVAVRTGGHQYSGASSTNGNNIQLDLSETYRDPYKDFKWDNEDCTEVTFGVSFSVGEFNAKLREKNRFVPHGQCQYVYMGGHIQTGGYGQLARSFGLLSDHVKKFRIITADRQARWVCRNFDQDKDLFFAVLGGSPGNFGVLTHITLRVFRDQDYPNSRGLRAVYPYDRKRLKDLLDVMVETVEDENFPADYDYCITVLNEPPLVTGESTYDMKYDRKPHVTWPPIIAVFVQWTNLQGDRQNYNPNFIDKIRQVAGKGIVQVSDKEYTPMSTLTGHWIAPITREFQFPYIKRTYSSNSSSQRLKNLGWTDWVSGRIEDGWNLKLKVSAQFHHYGGSNSLFYQNGQNSPTSFSWRDTRINCTLDVFYHSYQYEQAAEWQKINDKKGVGDSNAKFCEHDRRVLWGSFDLDLSAAQQYYYDQHPEGKYERLCKIKKDYDPSDVFTPNRFCIGLGLVQPRIKLASLETAKEEVAAMVEKESHLSVEDKFWEMEGMKREVGKSVPLWDTWCA